MEKSEQGYADRKPRQGPRSPLHRRRHCGGPGFALATGEKFKNKTGEWEEKTEWHNVTLSARLAEIAGEYLARGRLFTSKRRPADQEMAGSRWKGPLYD